MACSGFWSGIMQEKDGFKGTTVYKRIMKRFLKQDWTV
jgi:hypothetical protein